MRKVWNRLSSIFARSMALNPMMRGTSSGLEVATMTSRQSVLGTSESVAKSLNYLTPSLPASSPCQRRSIDALSLLNDHPYLNRYSITSGEIMTTTSLVLPDGSSSM